ncbi:PREDICTED: uncharacterized protein LOC105149952 [Acromyrmex echinatior]|uniref:uncharacterized protein LOC105149952 n=1 Tax=Acromyrmex echinatior TaxID=103372 RepID=UPI000580FD67|nr:PREDICTED: uncharacterized protein LOC105149952 [Acromyrmex echinatior]
MSEILDFVAAHRMIDTMEFVFRGKLRLSSNKNFFLEGEWLQYIFLLRAQEILDMCLLTNLIAVRIPLSESKASACIQEQQSPFYKLIFCVVSFFYVYVII